MSEWHCPILATRASPEVAYSPREASEGKKVTNHESASVVSIGTAPKPTRGSVLVVTPGTSDVPVAEEAAVTAEPMGLLVKRL